MYKKPTNKETEKSKKKHGLCALVCQVDEIYKDDYTHYQWLKLKHLQPQGQKV